MKEMKTKWALSAFHKNTSHGRGFYYFFPSLFIELTQLCIDL